MVIVAQLVEPRIVVPAVVGSSPIGHPRLAIIKTRLSIYGIVTKGCGGPLAQLVEQLTLNQRVAGSIPARPTRTGENMYDQFRLLALLPNLRGIRCESGGTGRRAGFRCQWGNPWEFDSPLSHQRFKSLTIVQLPHSGKPSYGCLC